MSTTAFAEKTQAYDIIVDVDNPGYEVSSIRVRRIADDNAPKFFCQKLHWFLKPYLAPREWDVDLDVQAFGDGEFAGTVKPHWLHTGICSSSLVTSFRVTIKDVMTNEEFHFESYTYNDADETIIFEANCSISDDPSQTYCHLEESDHFFGTEDNYILVEVN